MTTTWTDATTYAQGQRGKIEPTKWECTVANVRIFITKNHLYHPEEWVMNSSALYIGHRFLGPSSMAADDAKAAALRIAVAAAENDIRELNNFIALVAAE